jgi:hypothetical protein
MVRLAYCLLAALAVVACTNATGHVEGGDLLIADPCAPGAAATWTNLYTCYWGPTGAASCTAQTSCHGGSQELGSTTTGFVCADKDSCWSSMTQMGTGGLPPILCLSTAGCTSGVTSYEDTQLWGGLHQAGSPPTLDNMPCGNPLAVPSCTPAEAKYTFSTYDLDQISTWIQGGAQDN